MLSSLDAENGRMGVVLPHGVLFRGASEGKIRRQLVEMNLLDAVIGLPANLFYGTGIPACILVFKKNRTCRDVLFIDASGDGNFEKGKNQNILRDSDITSIVNAYQARQNEDKYSYGASFDEIKENDFNLNIPRYVDTFEEEGLVDIDEVQKNIASIEAELAEVQAKMVEYLKELGLYRRDKPVLEALSILTKTNFIPINGKLMAKTMYNPRQYPRKKPQVFQLL